MSKVLAAPGVTGLLPASSKYLPWFSVDPFPPMCVISSDKGIFIVFKGHWNPKEPHINGP